MLAGPACPSSAYLAIVPRGRGDLFIALDTCLADSGVEVLWDRRLAERRCRVDRVVG